MHIHCQMFGEASVYVCMCVCMCVLACVHVCACMCACADVYISICIAKHITGMWLSCCICQSLIIDRLLYCTVSICVCMCMCLHIFDMLRN